MPEQNRPPKRKSVSHLLGLGRRAGTLLLGGEQVRAALKRQDVHLVVVARDRSKRTEDKVIRLATALSIPVVTDGLAIEMGQAVGRGPVHVIGVRDAQLAAGIQAGTSGDAR